MYRSPSPFTYINTALRLLSASVSRTFFRLGLAAQKRIARSVHGRCQAAKTCISIRNRDIFVLLFNQCFLTQDTARAVACRDVTSSFSKNSILKSSPRELSLSGREKRRRRRGRFKRRGRNGRKRRNRRRHLANELRGELGSLCHRRLGCARTRPREGCNRDVHRLCDSYYFYSS